MLKTRILTAVLMLLLFLAALLYLSAIFWTLLLLVLTVAGAWEWGRLAKLPLRQFIAYLLLTALIGGELLFALGDAVLADSHTGIFLWAYGTSAIFWMVVVPLLFAFDRLPGNPAVLGLMGWILLFPTCFALFQLRAIDPLWLLGLMATVWISDSAAYFAGRAWGRRKLAPRISPGKTWEGVAGALAAVALYAAIWIGLAGERVDGVLLFLLLMALVPLGIVGDLFESAMKRHAGVKDSGNILPGHGGILDRIDALTSTLPIAALALLFLQSELR